MLTDDTLIASLNQLGVYFVPVGMDVVPRESEVPPDILLCGLARNPEARMRLALIPLFLVQSHYAKYVSEALAQLTVGHQQTLRCYYTAAQLLQEKNRAQLAALFDDGDDLSPLFEEVLGVDKSESPDVRLWQLSQRQAELNGKFINWYGTYNHAYDRLVAQQKRRIEWQL